MRWLVVVVPVLAAMAVFGSGSVGFHVQRFVWLDAGGPLTQLTGGELEKVIEQAHSPSYRRYVQQLETAKAPDSADRISPCTPQTFGELRHRVISYADAKARGYRVTPSPPESDRVLLVEYDEYVLSGLHALGLARSSGCDRIVQVNGGDHLQVLAALALLQRDSEEDIELALDRLRYDSLTAPEWALAHMPDDLHESVAPELHDDLEVTRQMLEGVLDEPRRRGLPEGTRIELPPTTAVD